MTKDNRPQTMAFAGNTVLHAADASVVVVQEQAEIARFEVDGPVTHLSLKLNLGRCVALENRCGDGVLA